MTCKDCIHCELCYITAWDLPCCEDFEDKSQYIKLPCKVGDEVTDLVYIKDKPTGEMTKSKITDIIVGFVFETEDGLHGVYDNTDFGKTAFFSKEEAEKALEEMKK